jgi:short-subunit dehydrogenase
LLVNIASAAAFGSAPNMIPYNATKAAVVSISESLVGELRDIGTQVSVAMPMFFSSNLLESCRGPEQTRDKARQLMRDSGYSAAEAAQDVLREASKGRTHIVLPKSAKALWMIKRWMPTLFLNKLLPMAADRNK